MRIRKKKNLDARIERVSELLIVNPSEFRGNWHKISNGNPLHIEIGCGKGKFICETSASNPDIFYIAIEKIPDVLVMAMEKALQCSARNVKFLNIDAELLTQFFAPSEVDRIYLNFSDPWPSNRHKHRRLTSEGFLSAYREILSDQGALFFKTDNRPLFDFSLFEFEKCGWKLKNVTFDLHGGDNPGAGGAMTEYEERFMGLGTPINRLEAYK